MWTALPKRVETGKDIERDGGIGVPEIGLRDGDELGPGAGPVDAYALGVRTKMAAPGQAVAAMTAGDVAFHRDEVAGGEAFHVGADLVNDPDEFVTDGHRHGDGLLGPGVPVIYMYVGPADGRLEDADEDLSPSTSGTGTSSESRPGSARLLTTAFIVFCTEGN